MIRVSAIIVAAGSSRRMGFNKLLAPLAGQLVLRRTLAAFQVCAEVDEIVLVAGDEAGAAAQAWRCEGGLDKLGAVIAGGAERHWSVWAGLQACAATAEWIAVHDGARPLIAPAQIARTLAAARTSGAAACARPLTETLKRADAQGRVVESVSREGVWIMETPQIFRRDLLERAYEAVIRDGALVTDEVSALQHAGVPVQLVANDTPNPKVTFPSDLSLAERFLAEPA